MPTVKVFPSFKITMYFEDHGAPHVHIVAPEYEAKLAIADGTLIAGRPSARALQTAQRWTAENKNMLSALWREYSE